MKKSVFLGTKEEYNSLSEMNAEWLDIFIDHCEIVDRVKQKGYACLLVKKKDNYIANQLLWECRQLEEVFIVDSDDPFEIEIKKGKMSNKKVWDFISVNSHSQIEEGGYYHCFNNKPFSREEVEEFADNVYLKLQQYLVGEKIALEIGCASGITMFRLQPYLKTYIGVDMAGVSLKKNRERAEEKGIKNIELIQCEANQVGDLSVDKVDIVIINSVVQYFPGINYLKKTVEQCISLMGGEGILFIGDIMDLDKRENLIKSVMHYKKEHPDADVRTDYSGELFLSRKYFIYLASLVDGIYKVEIADKIGKIRNEMTEFRYDVILHYKRGSKKMTNCTGKVQSAEKKV